MQGVGQVLPINPILTSLMLDYANREETYVARAVYPFVQSERDTGTIYADDANNSMRYEDPEWGRNTAATKVDIRLGNKTFSVNPRAYRTAISASDRRNFMGPMALENFVTTKLMKKFLVAREVKAEAKLRGSSTIQSQAAGAAWNNASLDPVKDIQAANVKVVKAIGQLINTLVIPPAVWDARFMTNAANTAGKQMRDQLGYLIQMTGDNITPTLAGKWLNVANCLVPYGVKAGGLEKTTADTGGLGSAAASTAGGYIWSDTTIVYAFFTEKEPTVGTAAYGISPGPQDIQADEPYFDWQVNGDWYRVSAIFGEYEAVPNAACKVTGV